MDFHTLSRKELQALCKKNKIPANMTNVAMANALEALQQVEGLDEILNPVGLDGQKFPDEKGAGTPDIHRTACRTSTRRKPVREEPESSKISTRRQLRTRVRNDEGTDQENEDLNVPLTPAVPNSRRRAPAVSTRRKKEDEHLTDHVPKTPAASSSRVRATSAYNTRKSVRLLEKNLSKMSLMDAEETGSVKVDEISEEIKSDSQQIEDSEDNEKGACSQTTSTSVLEETDELEVTSSEINTGYECQSNNSKPEVQLGSEVATDAGASLQVEPQECPVKINNSDEISICSVESEVDLTKSIGEEAEDATNEAGTGILCQIENSCDSSKPKDKISASEIDDSAEISVPKGDVEDIEDDVSLVVAEDRDKENERSNMGNDIQNSELMFCSQNKVVEVDNSAEIYAPKGNAEDYAPVVISEDNHKENECLDVAIDYIQSSEEMFSAEDIVVEMADDIQKSEQVFCAEKEAVEMEDNTSPPMVVCEELEAKVKTSPDMEESKEYVAKDSDVQVCIEPSSEGNMYVQNVTGSHSYDAEAEAEPETTDFQIDNEECKEHAAIAEETLDATSAFHCADQTLPTMSCAPITDERKTSDVPIPCQVQSVLMDNAGEDYTFRNVCKQVDHKPMENLNNDDLHQKSIRELKKMLKNLSVDGKTMNKINNSVEEIEKKRTALQALPENQMTASNGRPLLP